MNVLAIVSSFKVTASTCKIISPGLQPTTTTKKKVTGSEQALKKERTQHWRQLTSRLSCCGGPVKSLSNSPLPRATSADSKSFRDTNRGATGCRSHAGAGVSRLLSVQTLPSFFLSRCTEAPLPHRDVKIFYHVVRRRPMGCRVVLATRFRHLHSD